MTLYLYNTKTRQKELFKPLDPQRVTMYVCGPTVYNYVHIGNARPVIVFDTLFRLLNTLYPQVIYTRNITDIDDKIMQAAKEEGVDISTITERYTAAYNEQMLALHNLEPTSAPRATQFVPQMIEMIETLVNKGHAYETAGEVLFDVQSMPRYGGLSGQNLAALQAGASERVAVDTHKKHPGDFVLWKPSTPEEPGWDSPWGRGRPGWHTECVVMINSLLGENIDIHGGGKDLIFPHHENELAQNVCAHDGGPYVNYWMHNAFINFEGEKMSKSLGNFRTVRDLLKIYKGEVLRFAILSAHYRSEMDFSKEILDQAKASLDSLYTALHEAADSAPAASIKLEDSPVYHALLDDLNTPIAISELHALAKELNKADTDDKPRYKALLQQSATLMGLLVEEPEQWFKSAVGDAISADEIETLVAERDAAKKAKNYQRADEIREQLKQAGVILEDSREGTRWRRQ